MCKKSSPGGDAFNMLLDLNRRWICNINVQDHNCYINGYPTPMVESRQFSFMDEYCISGFCKKIPQFVENSKNSHDLSNRTK